MADKASGVGEANDAEVVALDNADVAPMPEDNSARMIDEADAKLAAAEAKVERAKEHLAAAEQSVADAKAEREGMN